MGQMAGRRSGQTRLPVTAATSRNLLVRFCPISEQASSRTNAIDGNGPQETHQ